MELDSLNKNRSREAIQTKQIITLPEYREEIEFYHKNSEDPFSIFSLNFDGQREIVAVIPGAKDQDFVLMLDPKFIKKES